MAADGPITRNLGTLPTQQVSGKNLESLQSVYLICSYLTETGMRTLALGKAGANKENQANPIFKRLASHRLPLLVCILTTSQFAFSDLKTVHILALMPGVKIKEFKAPHDPTFHAKGWLFLRKKGHNDVVIVGTSNFSQSAMTTGIELNIHTTAEKSVLDFRTTFGSFWSGSHEAFNENNVLTYDPKCD